MLMINFDTNNLKKGYTFMKNSANSENVEDIGVQAGGARGAAAPPKFGQLRFFGQHKKIWAKPIFKDVSMCLVLF